MPKATKEPKTNAKKEKKEKKKEPEKVADTSDEEETSDLWGNSSGEPNTTSINLGNNAYTNYNGTYICYAWKAVTTVSAFGLYTGTAGAHDVDIGFAPKFVIIKNRDVDNHRHGYDSLRGGTLRVYLNEPEGEPADSTSTRIVFNNDGFGFAAGADSAYINADTHKYIYAAFA